MSAIVSATTASHPTAGTCLAESERSSRVLFCKCVGMLVRITPGVGFSGLVWSARNPVYTSLSQRGQRVLLLGESVTLGSVA